MNGIRFTPHLYAWLCVIIAMIFYGNFRSHTLLSDYLDIFHLPELSNIQLPLFLALHLPSFLQAIFIGCLVFFLTKPSPLRPFYSSLFACIITGVLECLQLTLLLPGTFDALDLAAIVIANVVTFIIFQTHTTQVKVINKQPTALTIGLLISASLISMGCEEVPDLKCNATSHTCVKPITLTWDELRADIHPSYGNETSLTRPGKIHAKSHHLFIVDQYRGVHIFDTRDALNPTRLVFIPVIGALDLSIKDDYLYINSFVDLVIINYQAVLDGSFEQADVFRKIGVFLIPIYEQFYPKDYAIDNDNKEYTNFILNKWHAKSSSNRLVYSKQTPFEGFIIGYYDLNNSPVLFGEYEKIIDGSK